jgi:hypothetical protein
MKQNMTPEEALLKMRHIRAQQNLGLAWGDTEAEHEEADEILCNLLEYLGHDELVAEFKSFSKWYA